MSNHSAHRKTVNGLITLPLFISRLLHLLQSLSWAQEVWFLHLQLILIRYVFGIIKSFKHLGLMSSSMESGSLWWLHLLHSFCLRTVCMNVCVSVACGCASKYVKSGCIVAENWHTSVKGQTYSHTKRKRIICFM